MIFNWENIEIYDTPFKYGICDNFLEEYSDDLFPDEIDYDIEAKAIGVEV